MPGSWSERGSVAVDAGDLQLAKQCFARAVKDECANGRHRFHLAVVLEALGELAAAARELTQALRLDPKREEAARRLCLTRSSAILKDELLLDVLRTSTLSSPELESLLTAIRRVLLLELAPTRYCDQALVGFAVAMLQQCWINQFVWAVSEQESRWLAHEEVPLDRLAKDDLEAAHCVLRHCLYAPLRRVVGDEAAPETFSRLEPRALREVVVRRLAMEGNERERAARMPVLGNVGGTTSRRVAQFYEESPYPRWSTVIISRDHRATLARFLGEERAAFLERPFEVLIAGCGTGQQVVQAALHYGPNAG